MAEGTLSPAYFELNYHSPYGSHKALIGTKAWFPTSITGGLGSYENWNGDPVDAEEMIQAYADAMMEFYKTDCAVDYATIWTKETPTSPAYPRLSKAIVSPGATASANWSKAVQYQWIIRGTGFSLQKYVWLDATIGGSWNSVSDLSGSPESQAFVDVVTSSDWAFMTRKDEQPISFQKLTYKLNDKLRHEYGMD